MEDHAPRSVPNNRHWSLPWGVQLGAVHSFALGTAAAQQNGLRAPESLNTGSFCAKRVTDELEV